VKKSVTEAARRQKVLFVVSLTIILAAFLGLTGCQKTLPPRPETTQPPVAKPSETPEQQPKTSQNITEQKVEPVASHELESKTEEGKEGVFADILFDFDKYDVKESYQAELQDINAWLMKNTSATVSIEGNCDERGTSEYNLALGERRAKAVKDYLISLGVPSSRIETVSYGTEKPICTEHNEECWAKNRRDHFVILTKAGK